MVDKYALHRILNSIRCTNNESQALDNLALIIVEAQFDQGLVKLANERLAQRKPEAKDFVEVT